MIFDQSSEVNRGIIEAHEPSIVTSASGARAAGAAFDETNWRGRHEDVGR
jgi:hypothetical protein